MSSPVTQPFDRRRFLTLAGGGAVVVALGGCRTGRTGDSAGNTTTTATTTPTSAAATTAAPTTTSAAPAADDRILVLVQLNGGNDGLNTLVPADGRYRDARPGLGVPEADLVPLAGEAAYSLHPALAPLVGPWEAGRMAFVQGVGFPDPDRSHFVAMDTWWRAGDHGAPTGWLGRVLDGWPTDPEPLFATALGGGAPLLLGTRRQPTVVLNAESFRFAPGIDPALLSALAMPPAAHPLMAAAQGATARAVEAVEAFADLVGVDPAAADEPAPAREGGSTLADGLATAARMITGDVGARIVVVSAGGFDTHANQAPTQQQLLADLASGLSAFLAAVDQAGMTDRVLVATTSEFGRRVQENGSGGTDHGAGGLSLVLGPVRPGVHGSLDLGDLLDGDVRPAVDPRVLYTAALDWLGADVEAVLGRRYDDVTLLRA